MIYLTANALIGKKSVIYCSDFRYESDGIIVLEVGFFFFRQISTF